MPVPEPVREQEAEGTSQGTVPEIQTQEKAMTETPPAKKAVPKKSPPKKATPKAAAKKAPKKPLQQAAAESRAEKATHLQKMVLKTLVAAKGGWVDIKKVHKPLLDSGLSQDRANGATFKSVYDHKYAKWRQNEDYSEELQLTATGKSAYEKMS